VKLRKKSKISTKSLAEEEKTFWPAGEKKEEREEASAESSP
jgi:hypothetical protein